MAVVDGFRLHRVRLHSTVGSDTDEAVAHRRQPDVAVRVAGNAEHAHAPTLRQLLLVVVAAGVEPSAAFLIAAQPDASLLVFVQREHRCRHVAGVVSDERKRGRELVESVLVGAHPHIASRVDHRAGDAGLSDDVVLAQTVAHIGEAALAGRLHVDAFLQQSQPEIATMVLGDREHFALREVQHTAVVGILHDAARCGVVDGESGTVVADDDLPVAPAIDDGHGLVGCAVDMGERVAVAAEHTLPKGSNIDVPSLVEADAAHAGAERLLLKIALHHLSLVPHQHTLLVGDNPHAALAVLGHVVYGGHLRQVAAQLVGFLQRRHLQHTASRRAHEHLTTLPFEEADNVARRLVPAQVGHLHGAERGAVVGLQVPEHAEIHEVVPVLGDAVHVVVGHSRSALLVEDTELIAVITAETVAGGSPQQSVVVNKHLVGETARQLVVGII